MDSDVLTTSKVRISVKQSKKYTVVLHNDDSTEMLFVVMVLVEVFKKSSDDAFALMLKVHNEGRGVVDIYPKKLAEARRDAALEMAKSCGFSEFKVTVEEA